MSPYMLRWTVYSYTHLSSDPGVTTGVSPTLKLALFFAFFSKYFRASACSLLAYSASMALRSR